MKRIEIAVSGCFRGRNLLVAGVLVAAALLVVSCGQDDAARSESGDTHAPATHAGAQARQADGSTTGHAQPGHDTGHEEPAGTDDRKVGGSDTVVWGCECCPDVRSSEPGICPKCNMELTPIETGVAEMSGKDPEGTHPTGGKQVWTCSMHPDVRSDGPGQCPECNMNLVPAEEEEHSSLGTPETVDQWTCGMHPSIRSEEPGKCPICNMDLVPVTPGDEDAVRIDDDALRMVGAGGAEAEYLDLVRVIRAVGRVEYDERLVKHVASRVSGRVEKLHADFAGTRVHMGQPLLDIYSPELVTALADYKNSLDAARNGGRSSGSVGESSAYGLARSARVRLKLWGLNDQEIDALVEDQTAASYVITLRSPISGTVIEKHASEGEYVKEGENLFLVADLSRVWITADLYEDDMGHVEPGDKVAVTARTYPDEVFEGRVGFIDPYVDEKTRTAKIRMELSNPQGRLKPGMYVEAKLETPVVRRDGEFWTCPMHPEVVKMGPGECPTCGMFLTKVGSGRILAIPKNAVVRSAETSLVYVAKAKGVYQPRQVVLGQVATRKGDDESLYYPVMDGLMPGETVLTDAGFLVHSQARLTGQAASAYGGALDVGSAGHQHGR